MMLGWAMMLAAATGPGETGSIELRSIAPAADLVPCIARAMAKAGAITTRSIDGGTAIDLQREPSVAGTGDAPAFLIRISEAGRQRILHATYRSPLTTKAAERLMGRVGRQCFAGEWRTHEWERH